MGCGAELPPVAPVAVAPKPSAQPAPPKKKGTCLARLDPPPASAPPVPGTPQLVPQLAPSQLSLAAVSPDGGLAVVQAPDETLLIDLDTGAIQARFPEEDGGATRLSFRFDRRSALFARVEGSRVEVFDLRTGKRVRRFVASTEVADLAFSDDLRFVRIAAPNGQVESRSLADDAVFASDAAAKGLFALTADAGHLVTARGGTISVAPVGDVSCGEIEASGPIDAMAVSADDSTIAVKVGSSIELYDSTSGAQKARFPAQKTFALFPAGDRVMIGGATSLEVHDLAHASRKVAAASAFVGRNGRLVFASQAGLGLVDEAGIVIERPIGVSAAAFVPLTAVALAKDGARVATHGDAGLRVWPLDGGAPKTIAKKTPADDVRISFADRGDAIVQTANGHLRVIDPVSGVIRADLPYGQGGGRALFRPPKGAELVFVDGDQASLQSSKAIPAPWPADRTLDAAWSPDGARVGLLQTTATGARFRWYERASGKLVLDAAASGTRLALFGATAAVFGDQGFAMFGGTASSIAEASSSRTFSSDGAHTYAMTTQDSQSVLRVRATKNGVVERDKTLPSSGELAVDDQGKWIAVASPTRALVIDAATFEIVMDVPSGGVPSFLRGREILSLVDRRGVVTILRPTDRTVLHLLFGNDAKGAPLRLAWTDAGAYEAESADFLAVRRSRDVREKVVPAEPKAKVKGLAAKIIAGK
jgi:hypothetical protein